MAMMKPAREVRFSPTPMKDMMSNVPPMVNSSELPISIPARSPITSMMITITMRRDSIRLMMKPLFASWAMTFSGYRLSNSNPTGIRGRSSASFWSTSSPVFTTSFVGSVETPIPMARFPLTCIMLPGGSIYPFSMTAISPSFTCPPGVVITWFRMSLTVV